jgi:RNA polymerase sigma-70 factor (ECF subfamily)
MAQSDITEILREWSQGDDDALGQVIPLVFEDLRAIAGRMFQRERDGHTLQPTALVNELFLRLSDQRRLQFQNREQFFGVAAMMMRRILVDYAKARHAAKRGSGPAKVPLAEAIDIASVEEIPGVVELDDALNRLMEIDPRMAQIVEMRFFVGLSNEEIAEILKISVTTAKREWRTAKVWLFRELTKS